MSKYQVIATNAHGAVFDSMRDTEEQAMFKVADYISHYDKKAAKSIRDQLIFGKPTGQVVVEGYSFRFQYIP